MIFFFHSDETWGEILALIEALSSHQLSELASRPEIEHYITRTLSLTLQQGESAEQQHPTLSAKQTLEKKLLELFPELVLEKAPPVIPVALSKPLNHKGHRGSKLKRQRSYSYTGPLYASNVLYSYDKDLLPVTFRARRITTNDIISSCDRVRWEALTLEVSKRPFLPPQPARPQTSTGIHRISDLSLEPLYISDFPPSLPERRRGPVKLVKPDERTKRVLRAQLQGRETNSKCHLLLQTAEDVIHAFATSSLPSDQQEVYMSFTDTAPWNPYHLKVIDKPHPHSAYFVATIFGLLFVFPDGDCEHRSFAEWTRDKMVFHLIRQIPIFKQYLLRKMIRDWYKNVSWTKFNRRRLAVYSTGLRFHVPFSRVLWQINSLSVDLRSLKSTHVAPSGCYTLADFTQSMKASDNQLLKYLHKYFKYSLKVLSQATERALGYVKNLETERRHKPFVSDLPISVQKAELERLEVNIQDGHYRRDQLELLHVLVRQIVRDSLLSLVEDHTKQWASLVLSEREKEYVREDEEEKVIPTCLLQAQLLFTEQG